MDDINKYIEQINEATEFVRSKADLTPDIGVILGTGLGALADGLDKTAEIPYSDIPHFPISTVESHHGKLLFGHLAGKPVVCMQGRMHYYEGYSFKQITFPVRVMKALGIHSMVVSNACGGLNPAFESGNIMLITDHINFFPGNPLIGPNDDSLGPRFPDFYQAYDRDYIGTARVVALDQGIRLCEGVYLGLSGPTLETAAEYRMLRILGADAVGMSTVPEVIVARHQGTRILAFSLITDMGLPDNLKPLKIEEVIAIGKKAEPKMRALIEACIGRM
jgi:purine-nucleoside phosphorylase